MEHDDWRLTVTLHERAHVGRLRQALHEHEVEDEVRDRLGARVAVGGGGGRVFLYTDTAESAHEAEQVVRELLAAHDLGADLAIDRWHPVEERWEDEHVPLPATDAERRAELEQLGEDEIAESERLGAGLWEVRVELDSHGDAVDLAERLRAESDTLLPGWRCSVLRRWQYLLIGADNEDQATEIARRLEGRLPPGARVHVEPSGALAWRVISRRVFAVFGGLGS